jgi:hypothetical protein
MRGRRGIPARYQPQAHPAMSCVPFLFPPFFSLLIVSAHPAGLWSAVTRHRVARRKRQVVDFRYKYLMTEGLFVFLVLTGHRISKTGRLGRCYDKHGTIACNGVGGRVDFEIYVAGWPGDFRPGRAATR